MQPWTKPVPSPTNRDLWPPHSRGQFPLIPLITEYCTYGTGRSAGRIAPLPELA